MAELAEIARHYLEVLAGTTGRLALQAVYFLTLANTLPLADFGTFAAASATGIMLGAFSGFGFGFVAFRTAVRRPRLLGRYLGLYLAASCVTLPISLLAAAPVYLAIFAGSLSAAAFVMIVTAESLFGRLIEVIHKVNNGLGRFARGALVVIMTAAARALTAVAFALAGGGGLESSLEIWAPAYFAANLAVAAIALVLFCPPIRLRLNRKLFIGHCREAILPALTAFAFDAQAEIDKLVLIAAAGQRAAGIYAISVRIIELAGIPIRTFYVLYSRKLIREQRLDGIVSRNLLIEAAIFATALAGYGAFLYVLSFKPDLLGANVEVARQLFGVAILVPAFRSLMEYHSELYFAYRRLGTELVAAAVLVTLKAVALVAVVTASTEPSAWGLWLNVIGAGLYACSAATVYRTLLSERRQQGFPSP